jgi:hypothetical protein
MKRLNLTKRNGTTVSDLAKPYNGTINLTKDDEHRSGLARKSSDHSHHSSANLGHHSSSHFRSGSARSAQPAIIVIPPVPRAPKPAGQIQNAQQKRRVHGRSKPRRDRRPRNAYEPIPHDAFHQMSREQAMPIGYEAVPEHFDRYEYANDKFYDPIQGATTYPIAGQNGYNQAENAYQPAAESGYPPKIYPVNGKYVAPQQTQPQYHVAQYQQEAAYSSNRIEMQRQHSYETFTEIKQREMYQQNGYIANQSYQYSGYEGVSTLGSYAGYGSTRLETEVTGLSTDVDNFAPILVVRSNSDNDYQGTESQNQYSEQRGNVANSLPKEAKSRLPKDLSAEALEHSIPIANFPTPETVPTSAVEEGSRRRRKKSNVRKHDNSSESDAVESAGLLERLGMIAGNARKYTHEPPSIYDDVAFGRVSASGSSKTLSNNKEPLSISDNPIFKGEVPSEPEKPAARTNSGTAYDTLKPPPPPSVYKVAIAGALPAADRIVPVPLAVAKLKREAKGKPAKRAPQRPPFARDFSRGSSDSLQTLLD